MSDDDYVPKTPKEKRAALRWNCTERNQCFNRFKRPKIEAFAECFPGNIYLGDVDGLVEINGKGILLEFKPAPIAISPGQSIMYKKLSAHGILSVICLAGDARTMRIDYEAKFFLGEWFDWKTSSLDKACESFKRWVKWAEKE